MNINWYPGHMLKTKNEIKDSLKLVDLVLEVLDARIPISSHNPDIDKLTKEKRKIILLNKSDLADEKENKRWIEYFREEGKETILTDLNSGLGIRNCLTEIENMIKIEKDRKNLVKVLVVGIPNVGKSSFINSITKKKSLNVANKPGVTKQNQWVKLNQNIYFLDTPGVLWPKFEDERVALKLAYTGTIKDQVLDKVEIVYHLIDELKKQYPDRLIQRYSLVSEDIQRDTYDLMKYIGKKRGALVSGGNVDDSKTANIILEDFRSGKLGRITLDKVEN